MKIRNLRAFNLYFPYAGQKRGMLVKAGQLSMDLPTERYYDPLLQRDWRAGKIEVLLSETDKIVLGPVTKQLRTEAVEVPDDEQPAPVEAPPPEPVAPMVETQTIRMDAETGEQTVVPPAPPEPPVAPKRRIGKKTDPKDAPKATINQRTDVIRMNRLASELGVAPKAVLAQMSKLGMATNGSMMNVPLADAEKLRPLFKRPFTGSPALDPANGVDRRGQQVRLHEVPAGAPGAPTTAAAPGAPSLQDLQKANSRLSLGTPKFGKSTSANGVRFEMPGASPLGSTLSSGTPQAQRAQAAADAAAAKGGAQ